MENRPIIIGICGASGAIYGIRILEVLKQLNIETHLVMSSAARIVIASETKYSPRQVVELASFNHNINDIGASISSGSFKNAGMIIAPCSMKSLSAIAAGFESNLLVRAASVAIKERRTISILPRETPLSSIMLENMLKLSNVGVNICPPVPAFYNNPNTIDEIVNHTIVRVLDLHNIDTNLIERWGGIKEKLQKASS